jgi:hypothetical protein
MKPWASVSFPYSLIRCTDSKGHLSGPLLVTAEVIFETAFIRQPLFENSYGYQLLCYTNKITILLERPLTPFLLLQVNTFFAGQLPSKLDISTSKSVSSNGRHSTGLDIFEADRLQEP